MTGAEGRTRTGMVSPPRDFESRASTNFATPATKIKDITLSIILWFWVKVNELPAYRATDLLPTSQQIVTVYRCHRTTSRLHRA